MRRAALFALCLALALPAAPRAVLAAGQSVIVEAEGVCAMGDDKSRRQTVQEAMSAAKRDAAERAATYVRTETVVRDFMTEKDLVEAYSRAMVRILDEVSSGWFQDPAVGMSYRLSIKAEVIPDEEAIREKSDPEKWMADPAAPLMVRVWADRDTWRQGELMTLYVQGNKPFYAKVVYEDAQGNLVQLLPNPYRKDNYFQGGTVYRLPSGEDAYELLVSPPFGTEKVHVYASTEQPGEVEKVEAGAVYLVQAPKNSVWQRMRGIQVVSQQEAAAQGARRPAEFFEAEFDITTQPAAEQAAP